MKAELLPSSAPKDLDGLSEDAEARIDGPTRAMKRRDTGLCGKYWADVKLPAKRKRISAGERTAPSAVVMVQVATRKAKDAFPSSPEKIRDLEDIRKSQTDSVEKQWRENESSMGRKEEDVKIMVSTMTVAEVKARSEPGTFTDDSDRIKLHSECECVPSTCDCGLFNDLFLEESAALATRTAVKKFTGFNSLIWNNLKNEGASKSSDSVQYSLAQRFPFQLLSFLRMKPYAMKGMSKTEDNGLFFVALEGTFHLYVDYSLFCLTKGDSIFVPPRASFNMINFGSGEAVAAVMQFKNVHQRLGRAIAS